jgi:hypothetical protein
MSGRSSAPKRDGDRAQTGIDFLVAMSVFLIAVGFVFAFVPSMFRPFGGSGVDDALIADRSAAHLAEYALVEDPANPGVLSTACTAAFFDEDEDLAESNDCNFDTGEIDDLNALFGVPDWKTVRITIGEPGTIDWDGETIELWRGSDPSSSSETVSQRVVSIDGEPYELRVRVW